MAYPATFLSLQDAVMGKLRMKSAADRSKVKDWLNQTYADVCVEMEVLQDGDTAPLTPNVSSYQIDPLIIRFKMLAIQPENSDAFGAPLEATSLEHILQLRQGNPVSAINDGSPTKYALLGLAGDRNSGDGHGQLELWPTPTAVDLLLVYFVYLPQPLQGDGDVPVLQEPWGSDLLEQGASFKGAQFLRDLDMMPFYRDEYERGKRRFRAHMNRRQQGPVQALRFAHQHRWVPSPSVDLGV